MTFEEKKKLFLELGKKYKDDKEAMDVYRKDPVSALKKAGLELTAAELKQIKDSLVTIKGDGKCSPF